MSYVGGRITSFFGPDAKVATRAAARDMASKGASRMQEIATENTPIDTGNLRTSWYSTPAKRRAAAGAWAYEAKAATDVNYAPYVEHGTGLWGPKHAKYPIRPKQPGGMLSWVGPGGRVYANEVMHPGSPGQHMMALAAELVEFEAFQGPLFDVILQEWKRTIEAGADKR